ncbi:MAG: PHB depolymerase family esterase [Ktedonobacteraceae bacterium]
MRQISHRNNRQNNPRHFIGLGGVALSLLVLLSVVFYVYASYHTITTVRGQHVPVSSANLHATPTHPLVSCKTPIHNLGNMTETITSSGITRTFLVHLASSYGMQPQPLVLLYHGYNWTSQIMEQTSGMDKEADKEGFVLVYPQGADDPPTWNAGVGAYGPTGDADDIQFTRDMLHSIEQNYCVDSHRVYIAGFSLGGGMAYRLACTLSDKLAAVVTISGAYYPIPEGCHPTRPLPIMEIHGYADPLAPYAGNVNAHMGAVQDYLNGWLSRDQCTGDPETFLQQGDVTGLQWTKCAANTIVRHYRISDGQHTWPGSPGTTHVIDANVVIWDFFSTFSL